jgi:hypothetical protein
MQMKSAGTRVACLVNMGCIVGAMLVLGGPLNSRSLAQEAVPEAFRPATPEMREIELLRREVAELKELVRRLHENIASRDEGNARPAADPTWQETLKAPAHRYEILEEPRGHLLFPIHIERANYPAPPSLRGLFEHSAPASPQGPRAPRLRRAEPFPMTDSQPCLGCGRDMRGHWSHFCPQCGRAFAKSTPGQVAVQMVVTFVVAIVLVVGLVLALWRFA